MRTLLYTVIAVLGLTFAAPVGLSSVAWADDKPAVKKKAKKKKATKKKRAKKKRVRKKKAARK